MFYATLAQSAEQLIRNEQVVGSIPTGGFSRFRSFLSHYGLFVAKKPCRNPAGFFVSGDRDLKVFCRCL
jgi:hypothetical protein